jgi:hypothetical protein
MITHKKVFSVMFPDPTADEKLVIMKAPADHPITIEDCYIDIAGGIAASTANYISMNLIDGGTAGTATGVLSGTAGGTAGWTDNQPSQAAPIAGSARLDAGDYLVLNYAETGSVAPGQVTVMIEYVDGLGAKTNA